MNKKINFKKKDTVLFVIDRDGTLIEDVGFLGLTPDWKNKIVFKNEIIFLLKALDKIFPKNFKIVVSNQSGVARGFFTEKTLKKINNYIHKKLLLKYKIKIDVWKYETRVDENYAKKTKYFFKKEYVSKKTKRKPSPELVVEALKENKLNLSDFSKIIVIGDRNEDQILAKNLNAVFIKTI
ncbi:MAG: HAD hydrolase-like protein [Candidatus Woesearchaeota archaeon]